VTDETEALIKDNRGDDNCTTCRLCQQQFTTHRRLRVHVPQHYITTFCPVTNSPIIETMFYATNAPWPAIRGTSMMSTNICFLHSLTSSSPASRIFLAIHGYSKVFLHPGRSPKDPVPLRADTRRTWKLHHLLPLRRSLAQRHCPHGTSTDWDSPRTTFSLFQPPLSFSQKTLALSFPDQPSLLGRSESPRSGDRYEWTRKRNSYLGPQNHSSGLWTAGPPQVSQPTQTGTTGLSVHPTTLPRHRLCNNPGAADEALHPSLPVLHYFPPQVVYLFSRPRL